MRVGRLAIDRSIYPILSKFAAEDVERSHIVLKKSFNAMLLFVLLLAVGTFYAAPQIIALFGGGGFGDSVLVLRILSIAMVGSYLSSIFVPYLVAHRAQKWAVWSLGVSVIVNLVLNVALIPLYSYYGAAWTTAASEMM